MPPAANERHVFLEGGRVELPNWRARADEVQALLEVYCVDQRLTPARAPDLPPMVNGVFVGAAEGLIVGAYRLLAAYVLFPIEGIEHEADGVTPKRDADGDLVYIYGPPGWFVRVDTIATVAPAATT